MGDLVSMTSNPMEEMVQQAMESAIRNVIQETMAPILLRLTEVEGTAAATRKDVTELVEQVKGFVSDWDAIKTSGGFIARLLKTG